MTVQNLVNLEEVKRTLLANEKVLEVKDLHITQITNKMLVATTHLSLNLKDLKEFDSLAKNLSKELLHKFEIGHTTIQPSFKE